MILRSENQSPFVKQLHLCLKEYWIRKVRDQEARGKIQRPTEGSVGICWLSHIGRSSLDRQTKSGFPIFHLRKTKTKQKKQKKNINNKM